MITSVYEYGSLEGLSYLTFLFLALIIAFKIMLTIYRDRQIFIGDLLIPLGPLFWFGFMTYIILITGCTIEFFFAGRFDVSSKIQIFITSVAAVTPLYWFSAVAWVKLLEPYIARKKSKELYRSYWG